MLRIEYGPNADTQPAASAGVRELPTLPLDWLEIQDG